MRGALVVILLTFGCASQKPAQTKVASNDVAYSSAGQAKPKGTMHCHMERDTGSNFMEKVCTYEDKKDLGDSSVDDAMLQMERRSLQHVNPGSVAPGSGTGNGNGG